MKRFFLLAIVLSLTISCADEKSKNELILGTWKIKSAPNKEGVTISDKTTFYKGGSGITDIWINSSANKKIKFSYAIDDKTNIIHINHGYEKFDQKIEMLTKNELHLKSVKNDTIIMIYLKIK